MPSRCEIETRSPCAVVHMPRGFRLCGRPSEARGLGIASWVLLDGTMCEKWINSHELASGGWLARWLLLRTALPLLALPSTHCSSKASWTRMQRCCCTTTTTRHNRACHACTYTGVLSLTPEREEVYQRLIATFPAPTGPQSHAVRFLRAFCILMRHLQSPAV